MTSRPTAAPGLDPRHIIRTVEQLRSRIGERFPDRGLVTRAQELVDIAHATVRHVEQATAPHLPLRLAVAVLLAGLAAILARLALVFGHPVRFADFASFLQGLESATQEIALLIAAAVFLLTLENRVKRGRALRFIRDLRAFAHIVDMQQLTKDPSAGDRTPSSPERTLTPDELERYLDYCSEMLALISKLAALYAQQIDDGVVLAAVDEVEGLVNGLSGKIWQKIMILGHGAEA